MHFHFGGSLKINENANLTREDQNSLVNAYFTTMDIFKSKGARITTGTGNGNINGSNYFRVGPYGTEAM